MDNNLTADSSLWERGKDYPEYFDNDSLATISKGYLLPGETPKKAYRRVAQAAAMRLNRPDLENKFFKIIWNG
jgi:ribonucleoside-diphosphate reductase alpha chain